MFKLDRPELIAGYTGHIPGTRWVYGRQASRERTDLTNSSSDFSHNESSHYQEPMRADPRHEEDGRISRLSTTGLHTVRSYRQRPPSAHMRRFRSVDSLREVAVQSDAMESVLSELVNDESRERQHDRTYRDVSSNIPDAPPTPPERFSTTAKDNETDSGISNDHHRENSSNSRSSSYSRYLRNHSATRPNIFSAGLPTAGYTGYVPGWKQVIGKSFSSSLQQLKQRELAKLEKLNHLKNSRQGSRPPSRSGPESRYRSSSEHRRYRQD